MMERSKTYSNGAGVVRLIYVWPSVGQRYRFVARVKAGLAELRSDSPDVEILGRMGDGAESLVVDCVKGVSIDGVAIDWPEHEEGRREWLRSLLPPGDVEDLANLLVNPLTPGDEGKSGGQSG